MLPIEISSVSHLPDDILSDIRPRLNILTLLTVAVVEEWKALDQVADRFEEGIDRIGGDAEDGRKSGVRRCR